MLECQDPVAADFCSVLKQSLDQAA
jgi:hypothetical protein